MDPHDLPQHNRTRDQMEQGSSSPEITVTRTVVPPDRRREDERGYQTGCNPDRQGIHSHNLEQTTHKRSTLTERLNQQRLHANTAAHTVIPDWYRIDTATCGHGTGCETITPDAPHSDLQQGEQVTEPIVRDQEAEENTTTAARLDRFWVPADMAPFCRTRYLLESPAESDHLAVVLEIQGMGFMMVRNRPGRAEKRKIYSTEPIKTEK